MPVNPEVSKLLAEGPEALEALAAIADRERRAHPPVMSLAGAAVSGVIPKKVFSGASLLSAQRAIANEHERVLCVRYGHELDEGIDPTPDPLARQYLDLVGLIDQDERLPLEPEVQTT